jgi:hypothetical protein
MDLGTKMKIAFLIMLLAILAILILLYMGVH